jgi:uridine kinase
MTFAIAVAGGSGSGKTSIVEGVLDQVGGCALDIDSYYHDRHALPATPRRGLNYDEPGAIDSALLVEHVVALVGGASIMKPVYSFVSHCRTGAEPVHPAPLLVVEGLFALWWPELRSLFDLRVFVDAPADVRLVRRIRRDVNERCRDLDGVLRQYLQTVRPMHDRYVESGRTHADLVIVNEGRMQEAIDTIAQAVRGLTVHPARE